MSALSTAARQEYYVELANSLPPPLVDQPEYRQRRLTAAVEAFEALCPGDSYEARLAVQIVLSGAHAAESLREAGVYREDFPKRSRCRAQAASMMREERAARRMLAQEQKVRLATQAVASTPKPQPAAASASPPPEQAGSPPPPSPEAIAKAEAFAQKDVVAAAQIRHDRGVTPHSKAHFSHLWLPTDPAVIDAVVRGTSDALTLLDAVGGETRDRPPDGPGMKTWDAVPQIVTLRQQRDGSGTRYPAARLRANRLKGPGCTGRPAGLSSTTKRWSRNRIGGMSAPCGNSGRGLASITGALLRIAMLTVQAAMVNGCAASRGAVPRRDLPEQSTPYCEPAPCWRRTRRNRSPRARRKTAKREWSALQPSGWYPAARYGGAHTGREESARDTMHRLRPGRNPTSTRVCPWAIAAPRGTNAMTPIRSASPATGRCAGVMSL